MNGATTFEQIIGACTDSTCGPDFPCEMCSFRALTADAHDGNTAAQQMLDHRVWGSWLTGFSAADQMMVADLAPGDTPERPTEGPAERQKNGEARKVWKARWRKIGSDWVVEVCQSAKTGDTVTVRSSNGSKTVVLGELVVASNRDDKQMFRPRGEQAASVEPVEGGWYLTSDGAAVRAVRAQAGHLYGMRWNEETGGLVFEAGLLRNVIGECDAPDGFASPAPAPVSAPASASVPVEVTPGLWATADGTIVRAQESQAGRMYGLIVTTDNPKGRYAPGVLAKVVRPLTLAEAQTFGRETGVCCSCRRQLTDPESIAAGIGPVCATRF